MYRLVFHFIMVIGFEERVLCSTTIIYYFSKKLRTWKIENNVKDQTFTVDRDNKRTWGHFAGVQFKGIVTRTAKNTQTRLNRCEWWTSTSSVRQSCLVIGLSIHRQQHVAELLIKCPSLTCESPLENII